MVKIYHNPRCKKSRAGLSYLQEKNKDFEIIEYLKKPLSTEQLEKLLVKLDKKPEDILRKQEDVYRKQFKGKNFTDSEWVKIMTEHPKLIMRPIVEAQHKAVIGDPPENINDLV